MPAPAPDGPPSSRVDPDWQAPRDDASTLRTELYLQSGTVLRQITRSNAEGDPRLRYLVSDFDWDRAGTRIAFLVASVAGTVPVASEIWMVTFPEPQ